MTAFFLSSLETVETCPNLECSVGSEINQRLRFVNFSAAIRAKLGRLQIFDNAGFAESVKTFCDGRRVDEIARAQDANDVSVQLAYLDH